MGFFSMSVPATDLYNRILVFMLWPEMGKNKDGIPLEDRIRLIRIRTFFDQARGNQYGLVGAAVIAFLVLQSVGLPGSSLLVWLCLALVSSAITEFFEMYVRRTGVSHTNAERLLHIRFFLGSLSCIVFGATVTLLSDQSTDTAYALVFILTSSVVAVGYMAYSTAFSYCLMVNLLTLVPFTLLCFYRFAMNGSRFLLWMGVASIVLQGILLWKALQVFRAAIGKIESGERLIDEMADRRLAEEALRLSEQQSQRLASMLRLMCDNVPDMIWAKDNESRYLFANQALCDQLLMAVDTQEPVGKTFDFFVRREQAKHPDDGDWYTFGQFSMDIDRHAISRDEPTVFEESGNVCGKFVFLDIHQARFVNAAGEVIGTVGCARDITERKATEAMVHHMAHHDVLTDLPNRSLLTDRLQQALAYSRREIGKLAVLFVDLDRLKPVNDTLGHDAGDELLKEAADRLRQVVPRKTDTVSRLGGDEFVVLLTRVNTDQDAVKVAEKILDTLAQPFILPQHTIRISASIGIAVFPQHGGDVAQLLRHADAAMYCAKRSGRNAYRFFDPLSASSESSESAVA